VSGRTRRGAGSRLLAATLLIAACRRAPEDALPDGTLWAGDAQAARAFLGAVQQLARTPAALRAHDLDRRLAGCQRFVAFCPAGKACSLAATLSCHPAGALAAQADAARAGASWIFAHRAEGSRFTAWAAPAADGALRLRATLVDDGEGAQAQPWEALLPARRAAAPALLDDRHSLLHLRLRSDRGLASFRQSDTGGWAGKLFGLESGLLAAMALEGTTELAVYEPLPGQLIPPMALAVAVRQREGATAALERLLAGVHDRWGATRSPWQLGPYRGACLSDLNVLPELAPCYVATDRALVMGWNPLSVAVALLQAPEPGAPAGEGSALVVHLDRFALADERLRQAYATAGDATPAEDPGQPRPGYPWSRLTLSGTKGWSSYRFDLLLAPAAGAAERR
jgi:hypothetical protein